MTSNEEMCQQAEKEMEFAISKAMNEFGDFHMGELCSPADLGEWMWKKGHQEGIGLVLAELEVEGQTEVSYFKKLISGMMWGLGFVTACVIVEWVFHLHALN